MHRVGVVDIGSNSVRLVIYGVVGSALVSLYDEKATCGLGKDLDLTGRLDPEGKKCAIRELRRFMELAADASLDAFYPFATAAIRDAADGAAFVDQIAAEAGLAVKVLSGLDEARYSAVGVAGAIPGATGVVGDLGGGSLEMVRLVDGAVHEQVSLPIGALRRPGSASAGETTAWIDGWLDQVPWLRDRAEEDFYLVGGAWRAFARAHIQQDEYPLSVIHEYAMATADAVELATIIGMMSESSVALLRSVSRRRRSIMPYAALALARIAAYARPRRVVASAHGLREGYVRHKLGLRDGDPLLDYCRFAGPTTARIPPDGDRIFEWLCPLFPELDRETRRWVAAACWLSDLAGRDHPDRRADIALARGQNIPSVAISHAGRAFLGAALRVRYNGAKGGAGEGGSAAERLLACNQIRLAVRLGVTLRLAHALSPSGGSLHQSRLSFTGGGLALDGPPGLLSGDTVSRRLKSAAREFAMEPVLLGDQVAA